MVVYLHGLHGIAGLMMAEITTLPVLGTLYQTNLSNPSSKIRIKTVPTTITNQLLGLQYDCPFSVAGATADTFGYKVYHDGIGAIIPCLFVYFALEIAVFIIVYFYLFIFLILRFPILSCR